jgi:hypothetical protein
VFLPDTTAVQQTFFFLKKVQKSGSFRGRGGTNRLLENCNPA